MKFSHRKGFIDRESYVAQYLALALFTIGVVSTIGSDDLLAAFAAGISTSITVIDCVTDACRARHCHFMGRPFQYANRKRSVLISN